MTRRVEQLARELVRLSLDYSGSEFEDALELIHGGRLFQSLPAVSSAARNVRKLAPTLKARSVSRSKVSRVERDQQTLDNILKKISPEERERVGTFVRRLQDGGYFATAAELRTFLIAHGMSVPLKLPSRNATGLKVAIHLAMIDQYQRDEFINEAQSVTQQSSLKRWSDLIVKDGRER